MRDATITASDEEIERMKRIGHLHFVTEDGGIVTVEYDE